LQKEKKWIESSGLQMIAISNDRPAILKSFAKKKGIQFPLLSDANSEVIKKWKLVNTKGRPGTRHFQISYPMTVLLGKDGTVKGKVPGTVVKRHGGKKLVEAWKALKK